MSRITTRLATAVVVGATAVTTLTGAGAASADVIRTVTLKPSQSTCVDQYAYFQVRGDGSATGDGARFKILRYGSVVTATPGRFNYWAAELRSSYYNFPGPGYYSVCAFNTGDYPTTATIRIRSDYEF
jgi:hypothetical protein